MTAFQDFFRRAYGREADLSFRPYDYQRRLAEEPWPEVVDVPTGMGKTAGVALGWLYRRRILDNSVTPRRLIWCLPMRVLAEQTEQSIRRWLENLDLLGEPGQGRVSVHLSMGGEADIRKPRWTEHPEEDAVLVGTQDMLLSRALMRGYGMSRYQWPVHFPLLHHDALWVFDEVQLMGPALPTSSQLEAFRRGCATSTCGDDTCPACRWAHAVERVGACPARTLWVSATLQESWLDSVDFRPHRCNGLRRVVLEDADLADEAVRSRVGARKILERASTRLDHEGAKRGSRAYLDALAKEIRAAHVAGEQTLVILNRVDRAQELYRRLRRSRDLPALLLHARFRPAERREIERRLREPAQNSEGRIVVATQAVEAGVDLDSRVLFTELAPWSSLVQRFGRCNRAGKHADARAYWIDLDEEVKGLPEPYTAEALVAARERLGATESASPQDLPPVSEAPELHQVLRRRDLLELFDTDPDLSGFDVDVSPYIRDVGAPQAQVFWRTVDGAPAADEPGPDRDELCPVSLTQLRDHLGKARAWRRDSLAPRSDIPSWTRLANPRDVRPGHIYLLASDEGGYDPERGFVAGETGPVTPVARASTSADTDEDYGSDRLTNIGRWVTLREHLEDVAVATENLAVQLDLPDAVISLLGTAGRWHDVGKAHEAFQRGIGADPDDENGPWAKSDGSGRPDYHLIDDEGNKQRRPYFRHELASMLAWLEHGGADRESGERDLIAYLIVAHHGKVRLGLRALPVEPEPAADRERLFARGVWHGDRLPAVDAGETAIPETILRLELMKLGHGSQGPSWTERTRRLLEAHGPFALAWCEALVRIADWRASKMEREE